MPGQSCAAGCNPCVDGDCMINWGERPCCYDYALRLLPATSTPRPAVLRFLWGRTVHATWKDGSSEGVEQKPTHTIARDGISGMTPHRPQAGK